ncbi:MAG: hypothetical protein QXX92_08085 [Candidatus Bathyarchaeia archaeon]
MPARSGGNMTKVQHGTDDFRRPYDVYFGDLAVFRLGSGIFERGPTMTEADIAFLVGKLFSAYAIGWGMGYLQYAFKRASDFV